MSDLHPVLRLSWIDRRRLGGLRLTVAEDSAARLRRRSPSSGRADVRSSSDKGAGRATFPPIRTDRLTLRVDEAEPVSSLGFDFVIVLRARGRGRSGFSAIPAGAGLSDYVSSAAAFAAAADDGVACAIGARCRATGPVRIAPVSAMRLTALR